MLPWCGCPFLTRICPQALFRSDSKSESDSGGPKGATLHRPSPRADTWEGRPWARLVGSFVLGNVLNYESNRQIQVEGPRLVSQEAGRKQFTSKVGVKRFTEGNAVLRCGQVKGTNRRMARPPPRDEG